MQNRINERKATASFDSPLMSTFFNKKLCGLIYSNLFLNS